MTRRVNKFRAINGGKNNTDGRRSVAKQRDMTTDFGLAIVIAVTMVVFSYLIAFLILGAFYGK